MSTSYRVALTPKLMWSIASFLSVSDLGTLMRVSQYFFHTVGPVKWRYIPNIETLMRLVPEAVQKRATRPVYGTRGTFTQSVLLDDMSDLTRFHTYAPWVQHLEVFKPMTTYIFRNSRRLRNTAAEKPPLPNLRILSFSTEHEITPEDYVWLVKFVCPTLVEIRHKTDYSPQHYLGASSAQMLIQNISKSCPSLRTLELYPNQDEFSFGGYSSLDAAVSPNLAGFSNLQSFSSTPIILKPAVLQALGGLPLLHSLCILDYHSLNEENKNTVAFDKNFHIPNTWFPALRKLQIYDLHPQDITAIWDQPRLVLNLRAVTIRCYPDAPALRRFHNNGPHGAGEVIAVEEVGESGGQKWINTFVAKLCRMSPHIEKLGLRFDIHVGERRQYSLSGVRKDLRRLPLCTVRLQIQDSTVEL
ncbi:hypothetical protein BDV93DRAFT_526539 [Ceratobasidium sp. AG-I]|nr:hypothetical protein BDV93DRAFT_526539 [Ceratobasidium sp. AG-I]